MKNFTFCNPTKILFGRGSIAKIAKEIPSDAKIMVTYGGGSIRSNGVYDQVAAALAGRDWTEFGGIEPNPEYQTLCRAVEQARQAGVDFLLAVGGGSVIDGTKFIAAAIHYGGDPWELLSDPRKVGRTVPLASVLTLPATGSEMNSGAVISRRERNEKFAFQHPQGFPRFSVLDPEVCYSLPAKQLANGVVDSYAHTLEQYLAVAGESRVMDRWAEGLLLTLIELAPKLAAGDKSYDTMADFMLTATMALNGFIAMGVTQDWATHMIGHELTALHGLDHGVTLAIVYPGTMRVMRGPKQAKLLQYAERVWGIADGTPDQRIDRAIEKTEALFRSLGVKTRLSEHGIGEPTIDEIERRFTQRGWKLGENQLVTPALAAAILRDRL